MKTTAEIFEEAGQVTKATMKTLGLSVAMNPTQFNAVFNRVMDALMAEQRTGLAQAVATSSDADATAEMAAKIRSVLISYEESGVVLDDDYDRLQKAIRAVL